MKAVHLLGRVLFGGFFIYNGLNHFKRLEPMSGYAESKGTPAPKAAVMASGALLVAGGVSIVTGVQPRRGLMSLIAFLVPVSLQMHRFWAETDPMKRQIETVNFMKNVALIGAALTMMGFNEEWPANLEQPTRHLGQAVQPLLPARPRHQLAA